MKYCDNIMAWLVTPAPRYNTELLEEDIQKGNVRGKAGEQIHEIRFDPDEISRYCRPWENVASCMYSSITAIVPQAALWTLDTNMYFRHHTEHNAWIP